MDFSWNKDQLARQGEITAFAERQFGHERYEQQLSELDSSEKLDEDSWRACADIGIIGGFVPTEYGGRGDDVLTTVLALETLGYGCRDNGLLLGINGQMWSVQEPLLHYGTAAQKSHYLTKLCRGEWRAAHGMTELGSGSDAFNLQTTAESVTGGYKLNGHKAYVGLAPVADMALVFASTAPERGRWGISAFLVELDKPGCRTVQRSKLGVRSNPFGDIILKDVFVESESRLGPEGAGASMFNASMEWERAFIAASFVGAMQYQLEHSVEFAKTRNQYGKPIGKFQSVANRLVDMKVRLETARMLLYRLAWLKQENQPAGLEAAMANLYMAESFHENSLDAVRTFGAQGYMQDHVVARNLRDSVGGLIYSGTSDVQRNLIAHYLGL